MTKNTTTRRRPSDDSSHRRSSRPRDVVPRNLDRMPASYRAEPCKDVRKRVVDNAMRTGRDAYPLTTMSAAFVKAVSA